MVKIRAEEEFIGDLNYLFNMRKTYWNLLHLVLPILSLSLHYVILTILQYLRCSP